MLQDRGRVRFFAHSEIGPESSNLAFDQTPGQHFSQSLQIQALIGLKFVIWALSDIYSKLLADFQPLDIRLESSKLAFDHTPGQHFSRGFRIQAWIGPKAFDFGAFHIKFS